MKRDSIALIILVGICIQFAKQGYKTPEIKINEEILVYETTFPTNINEFRTLMIRPKIDIYKYTPVANMTPEEIVTSIKKETQNYLRENEYKEESYFLVFPEEHLTQIIKKHFLPFLNGDNNKTLSELKIVFSPIEKESSLANYSNNLNLITIDLEKLYYNQNKIDAIIVHEIAHALQIDYNKESHFPYFLTEASATSYYHYINSKVIDVYQNERYYESLFILLTVANNYKVEDYYQSLYNNNFQKFSEITGFTSKEAGDLQKILYEIEAQLMTYPISNIEILNESKDLSIKQNIIGYDSIKSLYEKITNNLENSTYSLEEKLLFIELTNNNIMNIIGDNEEIYKTINQLYNQFLLNLGEKYFKNNQEISELVINAQTNLKEIRYYNVLKDQIKYPEAYYYVEKYDIFKTDTEYDFGNDTTNKIYQKIKGD